MAGYSGTPLVKKLGIKAGHRVALVNSPPEFTRALADLPTDVSLLMNADAGLFDVILFFAPDQAHLKRNFALLVKRLTSAGGVWIAWPKKASGVATDLTEDLVRDVGLREGLVDNKVCAVDETWSGLRFVRRLVDRARTPRA
jgi:hypothetical protein